MPPHNLQAEESLLGAMLLDRNAIAAAIETGLTAADFYRPSHAHIVEAILNLHGRGEPADPVTVAEELRRSNRLDGIGGAAVLIAMQAGTPAIGNAARYARIVVEASRQRRLIAAGAQIMEMGYSADDPDEALEAADSILYGLRSADAPVAHDMRTALGAWLDAVEARMESGETVGRSTGFTDLDKLIGGLVPGRLMILGGCTGMGKTQVAGNIAASVARAGGPVLYVSIEMTVDELLGRWVGAEATLSSHHLAHGRIAEKDWPRIGQAVGRLADLPIHVIDATTVTPLSLRASARTLARRCGGLALVVVDYLQIMSARRDAQNRHVAVSELAMALKLMAKELPVPVLALSQLKREGIASRRDKRPVLSDLKESGDVENHADGVIFVHRQDYHDPSTSERGVGELIVAKNRHGMSGTARVGVDLATGRWRDIEQF